MPLNYLDRPRVIYQTEALYTFKDATGYHFGDNTPSDPSCDLRSIPHTGCSGNLVRQLHRIQSMKFDYKINWTNVDQYGHGARLDFMMLETPDINIEFEYLLADGYNEQLMSFVIDGKTQTLRDHISTKERIGSNFFILTSDYGHDVVGTNLSKTAGARKPETKRVVGVGNAFLSQYALMAEVGKLPRARVSFEGFNMRSYQGICNLPLPSVDPHRDCSHSNIKFSIPDGEQGIWYEKVSGIEDVSLVQGASALRPEDITLSLEDNGLVSKQMSGLRVNSSLGNHRPDNIGTAHIQGFAINVPFSQTRIHRMGRNLEWTRTPNFPVKIDMQVDAIVSDLKEGRLWDKLCDKPVDLTVVLEDCRCVTDCCNVATHQTENMTIKIKGAKLETESFNSSIGDNKTVTLNFHAQVGSEDDTENGLFISGKSFTTDRPNILSWGKPLFP